MTTQDECREKASRPGTHLESRVQILGDRDMLSDLLCRHIRAHVTECCAVVDSVELLVEQTLDESDTRAVVMVGNDRSELINEVLDAMDAIRLRNKRTSARWTVAIYDVPEDDEQACQHVARGVKGLFYRGDDVDVIVEGIQALLDGDVWIPKRVLADALDQRRVSTTNGSRDGSGSLTRREIEILMMVATGATNDQIAEQLFISSHTVKTHLYNTFKKIEVPNRLQAALWATKYLNAGFMRLPSAAGADNLIANFAHGAVAITGTNGYGHHQMPVATSRQSS